MNAWRPKASPRVLFAAIDNFALGLLVATLSGRGGGARGAEWTIFMPLPGIEALRVD